MKPKEITMQIVKNIGNYEMARLQATYELVDGEGETRESIADLFREARKDLEMAFITSYGKVQFKNDEQVETTDQADGGAPICNDKVELKTKRHFQRVLDDLNNGKITMDEVWQKFIINDDAFRYFQANGYDFTFYRNI